MKKITTIFAALCAIVLGGCTSGIEDDITPAVTTLPDLTAGFADDNQTKTYVENGKYLRWHAADEISVFFGNTLNSQYLFAGETGANSGTFSAVPSGELGTGNSLDAIYAVYPYDKTARISDQGVISLNLPATQNYAENSFGKGANTMIATTQSTKDTFLPFKNACGYLTLKLYNADGAKLRSVEIKGNAGEKIAGAATATIEFGGVPTLTMGDDATTSVTLDCGENGIELGASADAATELWIVLPATTFESGITITATDTKGIKFEKSTSKTVDITRNDIQPMAALGVEFVAPVIKPASNEIYYTNGSTTSATKLNNNYAFGATYKSNKYDAVKECWVLKFDGDVIRIGASAFSGCSSLTSITIPESVTSIGEYAFKDCSSLTSITIPEGVTSIGEYAFYRCSSLTSITIPKSVTEIGNWAFYGCTGELIVNCNIPSATSNGSGYGVFYGSNFTSATIGKGVTSIGNYAFDACTSLTSVTIPEGVTSIGKSAFYRCTSLTSVTIPEGVTSIGKSAFIYCSALISVTIPESVTSIGESVFYNCSSLISVTIPNSVTTIGESAFYECRSLTSVTIPNGVTSIGDNAFYYCSRLTSINIPEGVTEIGESAFRGSSLTSVTIPYGVTTIARYTFKYCSDLTSITIPNSVTSIEQDAFDGCSSLTSITIPESVTSIAGWALRNCTSLTSVYCQATTPPSLGGQAFDNSSNLSVIYVPANSVEKYMSASGWSAYADAIVGYNFETGEVFPTKPAKSEIWYSALEKVEPYYTNVFGANIVSNEWDSATGKGVITFDGNVTSIGNYAFLECTSLTSVTIPNSVTAIGKSAFKSTSLTSVTIPNSVTAIGESAFNSTSLTSVTIPNSVTAIGNYAFGYCGKLTSVTIPEGVTSIGTGAFIYCYRLPSVTIPNSVTKIGDMAFFECINLTSVYCKATTPPSIASCVFFYEDDETYEYLTINCRIYVPTESISAYRSKWDKEGEDSYNFVGYDFE